MNTGIDGHEHTLILHKHVNKKIPNFENLLKPYNTFISEYNMKSLYFLGLTSLTAPPPNSIILVPPLPSVKNYFLAKAETLKHV